MNSKNVTEVFRSRVIGLVAEERARQDEKFGGLGVDGSFMPSGRLGKRLSVLVEEVGEVAKAITEMSDDHEGDVTIDDVHAELVQVMAVCLAWMEYDLAMWTDFTYGDVPIGWDVPGCGVVVEKQPHSGSAGTIYITFDRVIPFEERWTGGFDPKGRVPTAIGPRGKWYSDSQYGKVW